MRTVLLVVAGAMSGGCDDQLFGVVDDAEVTQEGYAGVQQIADLKCYACHSATSAQGQLDLETNLHGAVVGVPSSKYDGWVLVQPNEPESSLLYLKLSGQPPSGTGTDMPPGSGGIDAEYADVVEAWIADGAPDQ